MILNEGVIVKYGSVEGELVISNAFGNFSATGQFLVSSDTTINQCAGDRNIIFK